MLRNLKCCSKKCLNTISDAVIKVARKKFAEKNLKEQAVWVKEYLGDHHVELDEKFIYNFFIGLTKVCRTAWMQVTGLTKSRFYELKKAFEGKKLSCFTH